MQRLVVLLLLLLLLCVIGEHRAAMQANIQLSSWLAIVPVVIGSMVLGTRQELLLGSVFIANNIAQLLLQTSEPDDGGPARLAAQTLVVGLCVWTTHLRVELRRQRDISLRAAAMAHEIRQPLTAMQLNSRRLLHALEQLDSIDPRLTTGLKALLNSTDQLGETMVVMTALLGSPRQPSERVDLAAVLSELIQTSLQDDLQDAGVNVRYEGMDEPQLVAGKPEELRIICRNLIHNAIEALEAVPAAQRQLLVNLQRSGGQIRLKIEDSGPGLPAFALEQLQLRSSKAQGMGLGLHTAGAILSELGGRLELGRSRELGGAAVAISFPESGETHPRQHDAARRHAPVLRRSV